MLSDLANNVQMIFSASRTLKACKLHTACDHASNGHESMLYLACYLQFQAIGPSQREAILRALREDVEKLVNEYGPYSRESTDLKEALRKCEQIYNRLSMQIDEQGNL